jgi:hypothetical protein
VAASLVAGSLAVGGLLGDSRWIIRCSWLGVRACPLPAPDQRMIFPYRGRTRVVLVMIPTRGEVAPSD